MFARPKKPAFGGIKSSNPAARTEGAGATAGTFTTNAWTVKSVLFKIVFWCVPLLLIVLCATSEEVMDVARRVVEEQRGVVAKWAGGAGEGVSGFVDGVQGVVEWSRAEVSEGAVRFGDAVKEGVEGVWAGVEWGGEKVVKPGVRAVQDGVQWASGEVVSGFVNARDVLANVDFTNYDWAKVGVDRVRGGAQWMVAMSSSVYLDLLDSVTGGLESIRQHECSLDVDKSFCGDEANMDWIFSMRLLLRAFKSVMLNTVIPSLKHGLGQIHSHLTDHNKQVTLLAIGTCFLLSITTFITRRRNDAKLTRLAAEKVLLLLQHGNIDMMRPAQLRETVMPADEDCDRLWKKVCKLVKDNVVERVWDVDGKRETFWMVRDERERGVESVVDSHQKEVEQVGGVRVRWGDVVKEYKRKVGGMGGGLYPPPC
ncbi:hypothetical protein HK104_004948 [Borealophlyctis nickersoniae]|nr:hypothetical protein HK104_004948 [Borealophlyctis nickersoniae]